MYYIRAGVLTRSELLLSGKIFLIAGVTSRRAAFQDMQSCSRPQDYTAYDL